MSAPDIALAEVETISGGLSIDGDAGRIEVEARAAGFVILTVALAGGIGSWPVPRWAVEHLRDQCTRVLAEEESLRAVAAEIDPAEPELGLGGEPKQMA